jgi:hypothetical protein
VWQYTTGLPMFMTTGPTHIPGALALDQPLLWMTSVGEGGVDVTAYWRFNDCVLSFYYIYDPATAVVTGPAGSFTATRITVTWTFTPVTPVGTGGVTPFFEDYFQVRLYPANVANAGGFDPNVTAPYYDSGQRPTYNGTSFDVPLDLDTGSYVAFVRVASDMNYGSGPNQRVVWWSTWARGGTFYMTSAPTNMTSRLSDRNTAKLAEPHRPTYQARLYWWDGSASWPLDLVDGSVTSDARSLIRRKCSITVMNRELVPPSASPVDFAHPLHPFGSYISLARGVGDELVNLGTFRVESVTIDRSGSSTTPVRIDGSDWSANVADARFTIPLTRQTWAGATVTPQLVSDVAAAIIAEARCGSIVTASTDSVATNYLNDRTGDRMQALKGLADSLGWRVYCAAIGVIVFGPYPDFTTLAPEIALVEGENAVILAESFTLSRDQVFDVVVASNDEVSLTGSAYDATPTSPIARSGSDSTVPWKGAGPFVPSMKPYFFASPVIASTSAAQQAAMTTLRRVALPSDRLVVSMVPNPNLAVDEVVTVKRINSRDDVPERFIVEQVQCPLDVSSEMRLTLVAPPRAYINPQPGT